MPLFIAPDLHWKWTRAPRCGCCAELEPIKTKGPSWRQRTDINVIKRVNCSRTYTVTADKYNKYKNWLRHFTSDCSKSLKSAWLKCLCIVCVCEKESWWAHCYVRVWFHTNTNSIYTVFLHNWYCYSLQIAISPRVGFSTKGFKITVQYEF